MNSVFYFSCGGHSRAVADFLARELGTEALSFGSAPPSVPRPQGGAQEVPCAGCAVVVFPVYCQSLPAPVRAFLCALRSPAAALVAVYGGVSRARMSRRGTPFSARGTVSMRRRCARSFRGSERPLRARPQRRCAFRARAKIPLRALRPPGAAGSACASCVPIPATAVTSAAGSAPSARCGGERRAENASAACAACISARRARSPFRSVPFCAGTLRALRNGVRRRCFFEREDFQRVSV